MTNVIFVVGSPRSGTTYLSRALGLAEDTCYLGESALFCLSALRTDRSYYDREMVPRDLFPYNKFLMRVLDGSDRLRHKDRIKDAVEHMLRMSKVQSYDLNPSNTLYKVQHVELSNADYDELEELSSRFRYCIETEGVAAYARSYLDEFAKRKQCGAVIEKTPLHLRYLPVLHAAFPEVKIIMTCRDKRDCFSSYLKTFGKGPGINRYLPAGLALRRIWRELQVDLRREEWAAGHPWIRKVEFNEFIEQPRELLESLSSWSGLDFNFEREALRFPTYNRK